MPKKSANDFIKIHKTGVCVSMQFFDYQRAKAAARKAKRPFLMNDGQNIPTPFQVISKLVATYANGDYAIQSLGESTSTGTVLRVMFKEPAEALRLAKVFHPAVEAKDFRRVKEKPCASVVIVPVDGKDQFAMAKKLGLL